MTYSTLRLEFETGVAVVTLNRPEKRNAISVRMIEELLAALDEIEKHPARVVIFAAEGKSFCAGMDLGELRSAASQSAKEHIESALRVARMFYRIYAFPKPIVAAINGPAIAGGCGIATLADFSIAVPEAKFGYTEVKIGFMPALVAVFLRRQIAEKHARDLLLTGRIVDASEALRMGLITEVIPPEKLQARSREIAAALLAVSPTSVARTKRLLVGLDEAALHVELEHAIAASADIRATADFREGLSSFLEKRAPNWSNS